MVLDFQRGDFVMIGAPVIGKGLLPRASYRQLKNEEEVMNAAMDTIICRWLPSLIAQGHLIIF